MLKNWAENMLRLIIGKLTIEKVKPPCDLCHSICVKSSIRLSVYKEKVDI